MYIIVDANEIFSLLIRGNIKSEEIFFSEQIILIAPEFLLEEIANNQEEILTKTHRSKEDFNKLMSIFKRRINFIPKIEVEDYMEKALNIFPEHKKDAPYLALAMKLKCIIWSEEKLLKQQKEIKVLNTIELYLLLN